MKKYYLYLKEHNKTGLKYLGQTCAKDPNVYTGSGTYWKRHIAKNGYDVTTTILFETTDKRELRKVGRQYSRQWNVVQSNIFANMKEESGDGGWDHLNDGSPEHIERCKLASSMVKNRGQGRRFTPETAKELSKLGNKKLSEMRKMGMLDGVYARLSEKMSGNSNPMYGKCWCKNLTTGDTKVFPLDNVPRGWKRLTDIKEEQKDKYNSQYGKHWYNDGGTSYLLFETDCKIEQMGLVRGRLVS